MRLLAGVSSVFRDVHEGEIVPRFYERVGINRRKRFSAWFFQRFRDAEKVISHKGLPKDCWYTCKGGMMIYELMTSHLTIAAAILLANSRGGGGEVEPGFEPLGMFLALAEKLTGVSPYHQAILWNMMSSIHYHGPVLQLLYLEYLTRNFRSFKKRPRAWLGFRL